MNISIKVDPNPIEEDPLMYKKALLFPGNHL